MKTLFVSIDDDNNHNLTVEVDPVIDKHGRLIIRDDSTQIVYNTWRYFVLNTQKVENKEVIVD